MVNFFPFSRHTVNFLDLSRHTLNPIETLYVQFNKRVDSLEYDLLKVLYKVEA